MEIEQVPWSKPDIGLWEKQAVGRVMDSGWVSQGPETQLFEKELARYLGCKYVVCVNNGTGALIAALLSHNAWHFQKRKYLPSYTFKATLNALNAAGCGHYTYFKKHDIRYRDVNPDTVLMTPPDDPSDTRYDLYIPVSYAGLPLDPYDWGEYPNVIEDACESLGAISRGNHTGSHGWTTCFSFHTAKLITTIEGGAVATDDELTYQRLQSVRKHGESLHQKGVFTNRGLNLKTTDINSAIGRVQLRKIQSYIDNRQTIADYYRESLEGVVGFQEVPDYVDRHANMMFPVYTFNPSNLSYRLKHHGVDTRLGWEPLGEGEGAQQVYDKLLCLPIFNTMTVEEAEYVCSKVKESLK